MGSLPCLTSKPLQQRPIDAPLILYIIVCDKVLGLIQVWRTKLHKILSRDLTFELFSPLIKQWINNKNKNNVEEHQLTWQMRELIEELVFHAVKLMVGVVGGGLWGGLPLPLPFPPLLGRPAGPRPCRADQSHRFPDGAGGEREDKRLKGGGGWGSHRHLSSQTHRLRADASFPTWSWLTFHLTVIF